MSARTKNVLLVAVIVVAVVGVVGTLAARPREPRLDRDLCPLGQALHRHVVVLVDPSDRLTPSQKAEVRQEIEAQQSSLGKGDRLTLLLLQSAEPGEVVRKVFSKCFPGDGSDVNPLFANQAMLKARFEKEFHAPLGTALREIESAPEAEASPILQAVRGIATHPGFSAAVRERKLILFTDGIEHSEVANFYRRVPRLELTGSAYTDISGRFDGASVIMRRLRTGRPVYDEARLDAFWRGLFEKAGAGSIQVTWL